MSRRIHETEAPVPPSPEPSPPPGPPPVAADPHEADGTRTRGGGRGRLVRLLAALALLGLGAAALAMSSAMGRSEPRLAGGNAPVDPGASDPRDLSAHNSPRLVANPRDPGNLVVGARVHAPPDSTCGVHVSVDGGGRWSPTPAPALDGKEISCFSPDVAFGADGTFYLAFSSFARLEGRGNVPDAVWLATSADGGRTVSAPTQAAGPLAFHVRLAADPSRPGRLYLAWMQASETAGWGMANTGNPILVARSDDGGATWTEPTPVSSPARQRVVGPSLVVSPTGDLHLAYLDVRDDVLDYHGAHEGMGGDPYPGHWSLVVAHSVDSGATWSETEVDSGIVPTERFLMLFPPAPALAVDGKRVYVAFHDGRAGDPDVWLWRSADGGRSWGKGRRVNDTRPADGTAQHLPQLAVAPGGHLDVVYYDRRADPANVLTEVSLQSSFDHGATFGSRLRLTDPGRAFDSSVGPGRDRGMPTLGTSLGLVAAERAALAVWTDTRLGTPLTNKQNLARAVVAFPPRSPLRQPLRVVGTAAVLVGLGAVVTAARRPRREATGAPLDTQQPAGTGA